jgi:hypothetical protein
MTPAANTTLHFSNEWLRRNIESDPDEPEGCPACGAIAGACSNYPNCPGLQMSYSFSVKGTTKADAVTAANAEFDNVLAAQSNHAVDMYGLQRLLGFLEGEQAKWDLYPNKEDGPPQDKVYPILSDSHARGFIIGVGALASTEMANAVMERSPLNRSGIAALHDVLSQRR